MKAFAAHVKSFEVVYDEKTRNKRSLKTKWVKVVLMVPTSVRRIAMSVAAGLSKHMERSNPRWLTVVDPNGPEMAVVRAAAAYVGMYDEVGGSSMTKENRELLELRLVGVRNAARQLPKGEPVIL